MIAVLTLILLFLYFVTSSTILLGMFALSLLSLIGSSIHRNRMESQNKKKTKIEQEQLDILKQLAAKEGIELPEAPKEETFATKLDSFVEGFTHDYLENDEGKALRLRLRGKAAPDSPEDGKKIEKRVEYFKPKSETAKWVPPNRQKNKTQNWSPEVILMMLLISIFVLGSVIALTSDPSPELETRLRSEQEKRKAFEEERRKALILEEQEREKAIREAQKVREANDALIYAIHAGNVERVKTAIANGADVNAESGYATPLHRASQDSMYGGDIPNGSEIRRILVEAGADVNRKASDGDTPLHSAAWGSRGGNISAARFLIAHGADVNAKNNRGKTPWHIASMFGNSMFIQVLISAGATWNDE